MLPFTIPNGVLAATISIFRGLVNRGYRRMYFSTTSTIPRQRLRLSSPYLRELQIVGVCRWDLTARFIISTRQQQADLSLSDRSAIPILSPTWFNMIRNHSAHQPILEEPNFPRLLQKTRWISLLHLHRRERVPMRPHHSSQRYHQAQIAWSGTLAMAQGPVTGVRFIPMKPAGRTTYRLLLI